MYVFVYGTLKTGEPNHYWLEEKERGEARLVGPGTMMDRFPLIITTKYNLPLLLNCEGEGHQVQGEVYKVDETMLAHLDILEAHPRLYCREVRKVRVEGDILDCWVWMLSDYRKSLLRPPYLAKYSSALYPWSTDYLEGKDGLDLFATIKRSQSCP